MIKLKKYQEKSLDVLQRYLEKARYTSASQAYDTIQQERYNGNPFPPYKPLDGLKDTPYVCLRLPTGGGKTLLSAHTVRLAGESYLDREYPLALWLVPTNIIKRQTLETLKNPDNPNRQVLEDTFEGRFRVFDVSDFRNIRPQDVTDGACVIVSTFAALRVDNTEGRKVYDHDENFEPHFSKIPSTAEGMEKDEATGKVKFSFANLLHHHRPLVIVDEAHNNSTPLSNEVLKRVNAACVVEYTATPADNSNVIQSVSAAELKAEQMIKLPIILSADHASWQHAITSSVHTRKKLEELAAKDKDYIRPIILFQAENKNREITVEVIENYLVESEGIAREEIAIATGDQKELDDIDLFNPNCPIRYVITVQALKEGWDCSFAYVLCSVANTQSATAVEQLLGRILRMPYAKERAQEELNRAYAHVSRQGWKHAVSQLKDRLVNMGFEAQEAEEVIYNQPQPELLGLGEPEAILFTAFLQNEPDLSSLDIAEKASVKVEKAEDGSFALTVEGNINEALVSKLAKAADNTKDKKEIALKGKLYVKQQKDNLTPSQRGEKFSIPQLCLNFEDGAELAEKELFLDESGWSLLDYPTALDKSQFTINEEANCYEFDIEGQKIQYRLLNDDAQLSLEGIKIDLTEIDLCRWLDKRLRQPDIKQEILLEFLRRIVSNLLARDDMDMAKLARGKFVLEKKLADLIRHYRDDAYTKGYQTCMFGDDAKVTVEPESFSFEFDPDNYPANQLYDGGFSFAKHYYPRIGSMNKEESEFAQALDRNPLIKFWVRNLERQPLHAFWLQTASDKFYPDFVAQLTDGRLLAVEYKGAHLDNDETQEKELLGKVWAEKSGNLFLMAWKKKDGMDIYQHLNKALS